MAMHFSFTPQHVQLVAACYPPSAALLATAPEYKPNSSELSRLTYYASNHPGKITRLSTELHRRVVADVKKARSGNIRARASLIITLNIFKALVTECRRDLTLLSAPLMSSLDATMDAFSADLEIAAKTATVFTAWTTYTTGQPLGLDEGVTRDYMSTLKRFAAMCFAESKTADVEMRNRTRLIGLGALTGSVTSEALYNSSTQFKTQVATVIPALVLNIRQTPINVLNAERAENIKNVPIAMSPYISEFRTRPVIERRAASIHVHIDGEQGPSIAEVAGATLSALSCLLSQSNGSQVGLVLQIALDSLSQHNGWSSTEHCCWLAQKSVEWAQYQYRFAVPSRLVERLSEIQDSPSSSSERKALAAMVKSVLSSPTPLVNVSTSDILSTLTSLILQRAAVDSEEPVLSDLVDCIGALGTHIYYADQIQDLVCDLISRLLGVETNGISGRGRNIGRRERGRVHALRCLINAIGQLIRPCDEKHRLQAKSVEDINSLEEKRSLEGIKESSPPSVLNENLRSSSPKPVHDVSSTSQASHPSAPHRTKVPLDIFQETIQFLCDEEFSIRADYARVLISFIKSEVRKEGSKSELTSTIKGHMERERGEEATGSRRMSAPTHQSNGVRARQNISSVPTADSSRIRFLHALHASIFVLATSAHLSTQSSSPPSPAQSVEGGESPAVMVTVSPSTPLHEEHSGSPDDTINTSHASANSRRRSMNVSSQTRRLSVMRKMLEQANAQPKFPSSTSLAPPAIPSGPADVPSSATASDFVHILSILSAMHTQAPRRALLTSIPMLKALENWCKDLDPANVDTRILLRQRAVKELVARMWIVIGELWGISALVHIAENAVTAEFNDLFTTLVPAESPFPRPEEPIPLTLLYDNDSEERSLFIDSDAAIEMLASSTSLQSSIGLDKLTLMKLLNTPWSLESTLRDSFDAVDGQDGYRADSLSPVLKISPALMQISNMSLQSLARSTRGVGVNDLRDALHGRSGASTLALNHKPASISSFGDATHSASGDSAVNVPGLFRPKSRTRALNGESSKDVRDVLDKLGIGARNGANLLKASFSARQKSARASVLIPPYKS